MGLNCVCNGQICEKRVLYIFTWNLWKQLQLIQGQSS